MPFDELKILLLAHLASVDFQATERVKFYSLFCVLNLKFRDLILTLPTQVSKCNPGAKLGVDLRDRLIADANHSEIQSELLLKQDLIFTETQGGFMTNRSMSATLQPNIPLFISIRLCSEGAQYMDQTVTFDNFCSSHFHG